IARFAPRTDGAVRALYYAYDAGHLLALGLIASAAVAIWQRWGPRAPVWGDLALAAAAGLLGAWLLARDLTGLAAIAGGAHAAIARPMLLAASGLAIAAVAVIGRRLARPRLRLVGVMLGSAGAAASQRVLENDYPGVHLYLIFASAILIG